MIAVLACAWRPDPHRVMEAFAGRLTIKGAAYAALAARFKKRLRDNVFLRGIVTLSRADDRG